MKKMNLVFTRLSSKSIFTMILFFGLVIFTGQRANAQYIADDQVKEAVYDYTSKLPAASFVSKASRGSDKLLSLELKKIFGRVFLQELSEKKEIGKAIDSTYDILSKRLPSNKKKVLDDVKAEYVAILKVN